MKYSGYLLLILAALCCSTAKAATYYVDAKNGNDSFSGTTTSVSATNGPWQSIAKVNAALLQPGDQVLFSCAQTWYETLKPAGNGTITAKIYFGSYPSQCANKPKISGFRSVAGYNWQPHQGNIWKTTANPNLIINGSLSTSVNNWFRTPSDASQTFSANCPLSAAGCMNFIASTTTNNSLAISNTFPVVGNNQYAVTLSFYLPSDTYTYFMVRENGNSYQQLGLAQYIKGNGQWQTVNLKFTATKTLPNARLDIEVPNSKQIFVRYVTVQELGVKSQPSTVLFDGDPVTIAHHPNAGFDPARPESVFFRTTAASPTITDSTGKTATSQIMAPDLQLPTGGSIGPGTKLLLRSSDWRMDNYAVTGVGTNTIGIKPNSSYLLSKAGWGFYFYDDLWMLDSPGEWFFDEVTQTLYLWTPTNENPGARVSVATLDTAIDLTARSNLTVENLAIDGASACVNLTQSTNLTLRYLNISNIAGRAINALNSIGATIDSNRIVRTGLSAIHTHNSRNALIENNVLSQIGAFVNNTGKRISLPIVTESAIIAGPGTIIQYNSLSDIAFNGIAAPQDNVIDSNIIQRACLTLNDCAAIYLTPKSLRVTVLNNLILDVPGSTDGTPDKSSLITSGVYLDNGLSGILISGNTVKGTLNSIQIHGGSNNTITNNILYASKLSLIWQQEYSLVNGGITGNIITGNQLFPTAPYASIKNSSVGNAANFATYDNNHYSIIQSPTIVTESAPGVSSDYKLKDWQSATSNGIARNNDLNSDTPAPLPSFSLGINGADFMTNGNFANGISGWGIGGDFAPYPSKILEGCLPVSLNCIHIVAGASQAMIYSPKFAVTQGKFYRVTFDFKSTANSGFLNPTVRLAGPTQFTGLLQSNPARSSVLDHWERHSFVFQPVANAQNPAIANQGARIDIGGIPAGLDFWVANMEIAPFDPGVFGAARSDMLTNTTDIYSSIDCPTQLSNPNLCLSYVTFPEGVATTWPILVPPRSGKIVFTQNLTLLDSDGDGVADSQDKCSGTTKGLGVNTKGCSLTD